MPMQKSDMRLVEVLSFKHLPYVLFHCHGANAEMRNDLADYAGTGQ